MESSWICCPFCCNEFSWVHGLSSHLLEEHSEKLDTDYDKETKVWSYWKTKGE